MKLGELKTIADIISGYAFKMDSLNNGEDKLIRIGDLQNGKIEIDSAISFNAKKYGVSENFRIKDKDILMALSGATVGKIAVASQCSLDCYLNQRVAIIRAKEGNCANYLKYVFYGKYLEKLLLSAGGAAQPNLSPKNLENMEIPIPSLSTQTQIAQILDKSTALIAKRKAQIAELDDLISACYKNLLSKSEKRCVKISNVVRDISTGKSYASLEESPYKVLKTSAVSYGFFNENEVKNLPINYTPPPEHLLRKGDILVSRMNTEELVGASAFVWKDYSNIAIPDRLWKLHLVDSVNPIFIWKTLQQDFFRKSIRVNSSGTSGSMKNISQANFMNLEIYLPDLKTQIQFAQIAEKIHAQKSLLQKSLAELEVQHQALMQKAFNGQLVG